MIEVKKDTPQMKEADFGYTVQAIGPVIDVRFSEGKTPAIRTMLTVDMSSDSNDKKTHWSWKSLKISEMIQFAVSPWDLPKELRGT